MGLAETDAVTIQFIIIRVQSLQERYHSMIQCSAGAFMIRNTCATHELRTIDAFGRRNISKFRFIAHLAFSFNSDPLQLLALQ
jgi:hypothetical protein